MATVKPIILTIGDKTYTLEFNRNSVMAAERRGLTLREVTEMATPMTTIPVLFFAAFKMHHPSITKDETDKILFEQLGGLGQQEIQRLMELFAAPTETLIRGDDAGERKNVTISL